MDTGSRGTEDITPAVMGDGMARAVKLTPGTSHATGSRRGNLSAGGGKEG